MEQQRTAEHAAFELEQRMRALETEAAGAFVFPAALPVIQLLHQWAADLHVKL